MILGDFNKHCNCTGSYKIYRVLDSTKRTMPPKFVEPYSSEDVNYFPKKKKQKKTNQLLLQQSPKTSNFSKPSKQKPTCPKPGTLEINNSHPDQMILPVQENSL